MYKNTTKHSFIAWALSVCLLAGCATSKQVMQQSSHQPSATLEERLAAAKLRLLAQEQSHEDRQVLVLCKQAPTGKECWLQGVEHRYHALRQETQPKVLLSGKTSEELIAQIKDIEFSRHDSGVAAAKSVLGCVSAQPDKPPYPKKNVEKCTPTKWQPINIFPIKKQLEAYLVTLLTKEDLEEDPAAATLLCRNILLTDHHGCSVHLRSRGLNHGLRFSLAREVFWDLRRNWLKLHRLTGVVGPIQVPSQFQVTILCQLHDATLGCAYQFVGGYDV